MNTVHKIQPGMSKRHNDVIEVLTQKSRLKY